MTWGKVKGKLLVLYVELNYSFLAESCSFVVLLGSFYVWDLLIFVLLGSFYVWDLLIFVRFFGWIISKYTDLPANQ
jgi:hypothetical protein